MVDKVNMSNFCFFKKICICIIFIWYDIDIKSIYYQNYYLLYELQFCYVIEDYCLVFIDINSFCFQYYISGYYLFCILVLFIFQILFQFYYEYIEIKLEDDFEFVDQSLFMC